jgi:WD40 repeat protein
LGDKDVMADYIDDFQIVNVENFSDLYIAPGHNPDILVMNAITKEIKPRIRTGVYIYYPSITLGPDGLLYTSSTSSRYIQVIDPVTRVGGGVGRIPTEYMYYQSIAFGPDGLLYIASSSRQHVVVIDPITKERKENINSGGYFYYPSIAFGPDGLLYISSTSRSDIQVIDPITKEKKPNINTGRYLYYQSIAFGPDGLLYIASSSRRYIQVVNPITKEIMPNIDLGRYVYYPSIAFGPDGFLYISSTSRNEILAINPKTLKRQEFSIQRSGYFQSIAMKTKRTGQESLVTINLTLRTKNKYGKDRQFKKKDYHAGNYKLDKTDKYKRDTFSSTVLARNLAL